MEGLVTLVGILFVGLVLCALFWKRMMYDPQQDESKAAAMARAAKNAAATGAVDAHKRGLDALAEGRVEEALAGFIEAIEHNPSYWPSRLALADWNLKTNDEPEALRHLEAAIAHAPVEERAKIKARIEVLCARGRMSP